MKVAVTALEPSLDSDIDPRFGRARWIAIFDLDDDSVEFLDNAAGVDAASGAGVQTGTMVLNAGVEVLVTGHVGPKAGQVVAGGKIRIVEDSTGTVGEAVERVRKGDF
ncbi:MAG: NifB/NifX family molybdenum-iron cluster-binding protein [Gemmatimonadales bacterium]|nr:NifB/NifX family molybdenum-iron cluster-binding protein [Gemmatimonadales bacterium]